MIPVEGSRIEPGSLEHLYPEARTQADTFVNQAIGQLSEPELPKGTCDANAK